jgi:NAD(P)-dependent dehydrogenase (short-subunit alcohol dehydrogenase family)
MSVTSTLLVVGSGPGIGVSTASLFASRKFNKIALISRDPERIKEDRESVLQNARKAGRNVEVKTWNVDVTDTIALQKILKEVERFGSVSCVLFNAARVGMSKLLEFEESEILKDFMVSNDSIISYV